MPDVTKHDIALEAARSLVKGACGWEKQRRWVENNVALGLLVSEEIRQCLQILRSEHETVIADELCGEKAADCVSKDFNEAMNRLVRLATAFSVQRSERVSHVEK
jgi:hypothetical protein